MLTFLRQSQVLFPLGVLIPFHLASAIFRLSVSQFPDFFSDYQRLVPEICSSMQYLQATWIASWYYMSVVSITFRFVMIKYADRGLVNDRYYWNMNLSLLKTLFWVLNIAILSTNQGNSLVYYIKHGRSLFSNTFRTKLCKLSENNEEFDHSKGRVQRYLFHTSLIFLGPSIEILFNVCGIF